MRDKKSAGLMNQAPAKEETNFTIFCEIKIIDGD